MTDGSETAEPADLAEPEWVTYHLVPTGEWEAAPPDEPYTPVAFDRDGFIHTTHTASEVAAAGNRYYRADPRPHLAVVIDLRRVTAPWRYDGDARFPHIYGPLNRDAVLAVPTAPRQADGTFLPPTWAEPQSRAVDLVTPKIGVNVALFDAAGRVLLTQRRDNALWCLPSGHMDLGETVAEAGIREAVEETGLRIAVDNISGVYSDPWLTLRIGLGLRYHIVNIVVRGHVIGGILLRETDETLDAGWFAPDDLPPLVSSHVCRIADAHANGDKPVLA